MQNSLIVISSGLEGLQTGVRNDGFIGLMIVYVSLYFYVATFFFSITVIASFMFCMPVIHSSFGGTYLANLAASLSLMVLAN